MFVDEQLKEHLEQSPTIKSRSLVLSEWNMNMPDNIYMVGNYRYRPTGSNVQFRTLPIIFDNTDAGLYYTGATDADVVIDGGYDNDDTLQKFTSIKEKMKMIYSLQDCLNPFRPRSGINKTLYFNSKYLANSGADIARRPRYYMASRYDQFKYWTSYRTENNVEYGVANKIQNSLYYIEDTCPFVVYKDPVPANRIVVKMQTNVGDINLGPFTTNSSIIDDPFYGQSNKTTPIRWKIQYLKDNSWIDAYVFDENSSRPDGSQIINTDGYVELEYGLIIPEEYLNSFTYVATISSTSMLPTTSVNGFAYLVVENSGEKGTFYVWDDVLNDYDTFSPDYGWILGNQELNSNTSFVDNLVNPESFIDDANDSLLYREFSYISGIRVVVETMNKFDSTFDLIEMSPRLIANLTDKVIDFRITKTLSDIGVTSLPVGQLLVSNGSINLFDDDQAFNANNENSIVNKYVNRNIKFLFYDSILDVNGFDYFVPLKTLYSEGFPQSDVTGGTISIALRDLYFYLESLSAPRLMVTDVSLSYAISLVLDFIGITNYTFKRLDTDSDPIIPYFFVAPDQNVAQVLDQLAIATQTAMFFDEYNNFVVMSKNYLMPTETERNTDFLLLGNNNQYQDGIVKNQTSGNLPNIISISSEDKKIYNDGKISYTSRYIQRSYGSIRQSTMIDKEKTWIYKPVLLWELSGTGGTKTVNEVASKQGSYVLGAMPINSDITAQLPTVVNHILTNNIIDFGENIYWLTRYQGYFYANGEIIRYDAAEFNITGTGNVWISSNQEYQKYFASLPFNGKIYPTGLIRIYAVPYYETIDGITRLKNGNVAEHGRGQFGTFITNHSAGINSYWTDSNFVRGCEMQSQYLFNTSSIEIPNTTVAAAGVVNNIARQSSRNSIIKNFMATNYLTENQINNLLSTQTGTIQSSALVFNGPSFNTEQNPLNFISYVYKDLGLNESLTESTQSVYPTKYVHFGTRLRVIGKIENNLDRIQTPFGSTTYYQLTGSQPNQNISIGGGSGGMAVMVNPDTNVGYYFEIVALTEDNISSYTTQDDVSVGNIFFYKIKKDSASSNAIPVKLWSGLSSILVDDGKFTGQYRISGEEKTTVYDLAIEYQDIGTTRRFYLYINNKLIQIVDDNSPLPIYNNIALFTRGSSRLMFENIYALSENYSQNTLFTVGETISQAFGDSSVDANESFRKYAMSGIVQSTYLSGISSAEPPKYNMYYEEFGTIMRECAYFDIRYDRSYPALYAQISPTFNRLKGYTISGFQADSYGAQFLLFNATDKAINLDETTGNFLRIQGITFTQDTTYELSVDDYFKKKSNLSDPEIDVDTIVTSPLVQLEKYNSIKQSRMIYGKNDFAIDSIYIQTQDAADELMGWIINKVMVPRKSVGVNVFSIPTLQLGDIVTINYKDSSGIDMISPETTRFVIYNIDYARNVDGPNMTLYLSEV